VPQNGKENARNYNIIHLGKNEYLMDLKKDEVRHWLHKTALNEFEEKNGYPAGYGPK
jgi:hypothetical protein